MVISLRQLQQSFQALANLGQINAFPDKTKYRITKLLRQLSPKFEILDSYRLKVMRECTIVNDKGEKSVDQEKFESEFGKYLDENECDLGGNVIPIPESMFSGMPVRPNDLYLLGPLLEEDVAEQE